MESSPPLQRHGTAWQQIRSRATGVAAKIQALPTPAKNAAVLVGSLVLLTAFYLGVALRIPYNAEHAALLVMARSMLEGNWLLRGWTVAHQPLFTTELPFYVAGILVLGFSWKVLYVVTALHWAMIALTIIYLSATAGNGRATPSRILVAACLTFYLPGVLLANEWMSANHLVGFFYCLICLLGIRDIARTGRWPGYAVYGVFLTLAAIGDVFAVYLVAIPVVIVCLTRMIAYGPQRKTVGLLIATAAAVVLSRLAVFLITYFGGARLPGPPAEFIDLAGLENNIYGFVASLLTLFGVSFLGQPTESFEAAIGLMHFSGLCLFAVALYVSIRGILKASLPTQVTATMIVVNLLEFVFSAHSGPAASKYLAPSLFFGIILTSEMVFQSWLFRDRQRLVLACFVVLLLSLLPALSFSKPKSPADELGKLLIRTHLTHGYGPYWRADSATVSTAGQALVAPVFLESGGLHRYPVFSDERWYTGYANFLIIDAYDTSGLHPTREQAIQMFGAPITEYELYKYGYLLVWDHDITPKIAAP